MDTGIDFISHEGLIRAAFFAVIFSGVALAERAVPRRLPGVPKSKRWTANLLMQFVDVAAVRLIFPVLPVGMALLCAQKGWGLFYYVPLPYPVAVIAGVLLLDLVIYFQHVVFHLTPALWRLHMVHHTDRDIDVTTGIRFHPLEIMVSLVIKLAAVAALGAAPLAVLIFEILLNGATMFNHGNIRIPFGLDRLIRLGVVTPDMHRVHHSVLFKETNSNYGFSFPWWDRLFGTYKAQPDAGHEKMEIGLHGYHDERALRLSSMLVMPFLYGRK